MGEETIRERTYRHEAAYWLSECAAAVDGDAGRALAHCADIIAGDNVERAAVVIGRLHQVFKLAGGAR